MTGEIFGFRKQVWLLIFFFFGPLCCNLIIYFLEIFCGSHRYFSDCYQMRDNGFISQDWPVKQLNDDDDFFMSG